MSDSEVLYISFCGRCDANTQFRLVYAGGVERAHRYGKPEVWWSAVACSVCNLLKIGLADNGGEFTPIPGGSQIAGKKFDDVPEHVGAAASEAYICLQVGALRAAGILARAVIEATAKDKKINSGNLLAKIDEMFRQQLIREYVRDGAHEVRHFGNDHAHGDFVAPVTLEDTELSLELMSKVLDEVYQSPAQVKKARDRRAGKTGSTTPAS